MQSVLTYLPHLTDYVYMQLPQGLEGPKYTVLKKISDNIELRRYEPGGRLIVPTLQQQQH